jgi:hypothetical protein
MSACGDDALRAFDKTVRRKPLAFAADAMGFQSTFVWKLLRRRVLPSNRKYIDLTMKQGARFRHRSRRQVYFRAF